MKRIVLVVMLSAATAVAGCAKRAESISPTYVSPMLYNDWTCAQIAEETQRVNARAAEVAGAQNNEAGKDAAAMAVGVIIFWPALFLLADKNDRAPELARLKGESDALQAAAIHKKCRFEVISPPAKK